MNLYMLTQPTDARNAQDEIYQLMALKQTAAAENEVKKQREQRQLKLLEAQQEKERAVTEGRNYTVEGRCIKSLAERLFCRAQFKAGM